MVVTAKPLLFIGYGNPSRGDDGVGPELIDQMEAARLSGRVADVFDVLSDFQLQIELSVDLHNRRQVIFIDASARASSPFQVFSVTPQRDASFTSHALSPWALLETYVLAYRQPPPPAFLIAIPGSNFDLGSSMTQSARDNLAAALGYCEELVNQMT